MKVKEVMTLSLFLMSKNHKKRYQTYKLTLTVMYEAGIRPINVAKKKTWNGMSTIGEDKLMKRFGSVGVILKNNM